MTNLNWNPLALRWVAKAPARIARPTGSEATCPLCPGNESQTPPETWANRPDGSPPDTEGWLVRAVPNLFPALVGPGAAHEVIIHSPDHYRDLAQSAESDAELVVSAWCARLAAIKSDPMTRFAQVSVNQGKAAGASLPHPHSQAIGMPLIPHLAAAEILSTSISCPICELIENRDEELLIAEDEGLAAYCPPWSENPFEILIAPQEHQARFEDSGSLATIARLLSVLLRSMCTLDRVDAYNVIVHTAPIVEGDSQFHWHIHAMARIGTFAGIELGAGLPISIIDPVDAAAALRAAAAQ